MRQNKTTRVAACAFAFAASVFLTNRALACNTPACNDPKETKISAAKSETAAPLNRWRVASIDYDKPVTPAAARDSASTPDFGETIIGPASFYEDPQQTASGEQYDPDAFTAAAQLAIRDKFGGIRFGVKYEPAFAVAEYEGKKLILKFNDVGPLVKDRKFDLSRAAMAYFGGLIKGVLPNLKVTLLPRGQIYRQGPVTDEQLAALRDRRMDDGIATAQAPVAREAAGMESTVDLAPRAEPVGNETLPPGQAIADHVESAKSRSLRRSAWSGRFGCRATRCGEATTDSQAAEPQAVEPRLFQEDTVDHAGEPPEFG